MSELNQVQKKSNERSIFSSFYLAESEFAVAVTHVQEVVNAPSTYTAVPLAPKFLKGLFNLRGTIIPVVDLRALLALPQGNLSDSSKVAIVELEGACVGLLFDKTGEVFKSDEEERSDFASSDSNGIISGVFKKESGQRIVQILDVSKLFKLQNVPKDSSRSQLRRENLVQKRGYRKQCISFVVGPAKCSLPIADIQEIIKVEKVSESILGIGHCIGTIDLRGSTVPVIDFASLLKYREVDRSATATQGDRRIIVMKLEKELFGLMIDSVDSIISFFADELIPFPLVEQNNPEMFLGCITGRGEADILLLDHQKILSSSEINTITRGHSKIYQSQVNGAQTEKSRKASRQTVITFRVDQSYAVDISEVKEIIEYPKQLLQPPGLQPHVRGVLNLRGELVTIVDARSLYLSSSKSFELETQKVLIFKKKGFHFGLVVDAVDSIMTFADSDKMKLPKMLYHSGESSVTSDVSEAIEVTDSNGHKKSLLILSIDSIAQRAVKSLAA